MADTADIITVTRDTLGAHTGLVARLAETFEMQHPDDHAVLAWQAGAARDPAALRRALDAATRVLAGRFVWDDDRTRSHLQGEFLYAIHARLLRQQLSPQSANFD